MSHTTKSYPLLVQENSAALTSVPGISTVTFYKENGTSRSSIFSTVSSQLEQRVSEIVAKNPWLSGSIHKDTGSKKMVLEVPAAGASNRHFTSISMDSSASPLASLGLTSATPYDKVCEMVQKHLPESLVPPARLLLGDTHKSLFRVTLVQLQGGEFFVVTSLCHAIGDGYTFYTLNSMLSKDAAVYSMDVERRFDIEFSIKEQVPDLGQNTLGCIGKFPFRFFCTALIRICIYCICKYLYNKPIYSMHLIDQNKIINIKQKINNTSSNFVSSNDIITSWFLKTQEVDAGCFLVNFRKRVEECTSTLSGNYTCPIHLNREDYVSPELIRYSITPRKVENPTTSSEIVYQRKSGGDLNTPKGLLYMDLGVVTNWASFYNDVYIDGCQLIQHWPCIFDDPASSLFSMAIVFAPSKGKLALLTNVELKNRDILQITQ